MLKYCFNLIQFTVHSKECHVSRLFFLFSQNIPDKTVRLLSVFMFLLQAYRMICHELCNVRCLACRSQWPRDLRRWFAAARQLRLWVRIQPGAWMFVCCECCVLSGRGLCGELINRQEESYRLWYVVVCDLETS